MATIAERLSYVHDNIAAAQARSGVQQKVTIVAVTKTHEPAAIIDIYKAGNLVIGENRVQEAAIKFPQLPNLPGLVKRMIGHLQSNKVNRALEIFDTVDAVDSIKLADKLARRGQHLDIEIPVLLEINTSGEKAKFGFHPENDQALLECCSFAGIAVKGLMTIGPLTADLPKIKSAFTLLRRLKDNLNHQLRTESPTIRELSMGMSDDYQLAVCEGSTMVRLGTTLFGPRKAFHEKH